MKLNLQTALKWAGVDFGNPLTLLVKLLPVFGMDILQNKLEEYFHKHVTAPRRTELVHELRLIANQLEQNQNVAAAKTTVTLLHGIKL